MPTHVQGVGESGVGSTIPAMTSIVVRLTVNLPPPRNGPQLPVGAIVTVESDDPWVATQLSQGHMVPVGKIPPLPQEDSTGDDG